MFIEYCACCKFCNKELEAINEEVQGFHDACNPQLEFNFTPKKIEIPQTSLIDEQV